MTHLKGKTVIIRRKVPTGQVDALNEPIYTITETSVDNVLIGEPSTDDISNVVNLTGKKVAYTLGIPKGDANEWAGAEVELPAPFAGVYHVIGLPVYGIVENIPMDWGGKVYLERYV